MRIDGHWVHDFNPYAIPFPAGWPLGGIRWYGIAYLLGFLWVRWMFSIYARRGRLPLTVQQMDSLLFHGIAGVLIGGRLGYVFLYEFGNFLRDPLEIFCIWHGGMASHGGFLGVAIALWLWSQKQSISLAILGDALVSAVPMGFFLGRIANFINGELYGRATTAPWGIIFPHANGLLLPRHPSQLYEAILEGLVLLCLVQWKFWRGKEGRPGQLVGYFFIAYSLLRCLGEIFREPDAPMIFFLSRGQFYSLFLLFAGLILYHCKRLRGGGL
ncbi:MAG: prolipoprotein diacylglyceryl transferase [Puniceicoccales bacterium]|jgi:phosphatidylglycerol:prolipoprotein diacylglycerol transferase|nr:prolipoprotein diacylglyceryl transferase [Puniceicoccales bacterium]